MGVTISEHVRRADARFEQRLGEATKGMQECQTSVAARMADFNSKIGALQVKSTCLESRLQSTTDFINSRCRPLDAELREHVASECARVNSQVGERVNEVKRRLECLSDECESLVEDSLERRLAMLSGSAEARVAGKRNVRS